MSVNQDQPRAIEGLAEREGLAPTAPRRRR